LPGQEKQNRFRNVESKGAHFINGRLSKPFFVKGENRRGFSGMTAIYRKQQSYFVEKRPGKPIDYSSHEEIAQIIPEV